VTVRTAAAMGCVLLAAASVHADESAPHALGVPPLLAPGAVVAALAIESEGAADRVDVPPTPGTA
jgi:uncharacterized membrane-anchored protein